MDSSHDQPEDLSSLVNAALDIMNPSEDADAPPPSYESLMHEEESSRPSALEQIQQELKESSVAVNKSSSSQHVNLMDDAQALSLGMGMANISLQSAENSPPGKREANSASEATQPSVIINPSIHEVEEEEPSMAGAVEAQTFDPRSSSILPPPALTPPMPPSSDKVRVAIIAVEKVETLNSLGLKVPHHTYHLLVDSTIEGMLATEHQVTRRFSDFERLHKLLHQELVGYFIPPLPPKSIVDHKIADDKWLALRRIELSNFMGEVVAHQGILQESQALRLFLLQPGELIHNPAWLALIQSHESSSLTIMGRRKSTLGAGGSSGGAPTDDKDKEKDARTPPPQRMGIMGNSQAAIMNQVGGFVTWMKHTGTVQNLFQPPEKVLTAEESSLRQSKLLLRDLNQLLQLAASAATNMRSDLERMASNSRELGQAFGMLAKYEEHVAGKCGQYTEDGSSAMRRSGDLQSAAMVESRETTVWRNLMHRTAMHLSTIHDHWALVPQAILALSEREKLMDEILSLEEDLALKKFQLGQLHFNEWHEPSPPPSAEKKPGAFGVALLQAAARGLSPGPPSTGLNAQRTYQLEGSISRIQDEINEMRARYAVIRHRNEGDLTRMGLKREADFRRMFKALARDQSELLRSAAEIWLSIA